MAQVLTSNNLIESLKRRGMVPENQSTFSTSDFLDILNEEISMYVLPYLFSVHEEYLVRYEDIDIVSGQTKYPIPYRAVGNKLRALFFVDETGNVNEFTRVRIDSKHDFGGTGGATYGWNSVFYVENSDIGLINAPSASDGSLRMYFYLRPNTLVSDDKAGLITDVDTTTGVITMSNFPTEFATLPLLDLIGKKTPNKIKAYDIQPTSVNSTTKTITFDTDDLPTGLAVGDYVNIAEETIVPQLPTELHALLAQKASLTCIEALGDLESAQSVREKLTEMEKKLYNLIDNRVESSVEKIRNKFSPLRSAVGQSRNKFRW